MSVHCFPLVAEQEVHRRDRRDQSGENARQSTDAISKLAQARARPLYGELEYSRFQLQDTFKVLNKQRPLVSFVCFRCILFEAGSDTAQGGLQLAM